MFAVSLDAWTSSNGYAFMAIVVHYISNDGKIGKFPSLSPNLFFIHCHLPSTTVEECLIDFCELIGAHTGENMANAVWESLDRYGLIGRVS